jgi:hypothetical protein
VPRALKISVLALMLLGSAAVGAVVASRSNPFPPGVEDPGARPTGPTGAAEDVYRGAAVVRTEHRLFVGGSCRSDWTIRFTLRGSGGRIFGDAVARLRGPERCDFSSAQLQATRVDLTATGRVRSDEILISLEETQRAPDGSTDVGGLLPTLDRLVLRIGFDDGNGPIDLEISDRARGAYLLEGQAHLEET